MIYFKSFVPQMTLLMLPRVSLYSWCRLVHQRRIAALNVVIVEGMTQSHFYKHYLTLLHLRNNYSTVSNQR